MIDIEDIKKRKKLGEEIDHMCDIGIPDILAYRKAQEEYMKVNIRIQRGK